MPVGDARHHGVGQRRAPIRRRQHELDQVAQADQPDHPADDQLQRPEPAAIGQQQRIGDERRDRHADEQRHVQQQREPDGAAEELGEVRRHRRDLARHPHRQHHGPAELLAAQLGQVAPGGDAELGRHRLEQHRDQARQHHHPEQLVAVSRAGLDVGRVVAGVDIGDRGDHGGAGEQQAGEARAASAGQHILHAATRAVAQAEWRSRLLAQPAGASSMVLI